MNTTVNTVTKIRNIAIIAHVDHGKTTLVDRLLQESGTLGDRFGPVSRVMDANDLEKERGITIVSKNTALAWDGHRINIVDTPGHADFGGEVERVLSMVDSVLLLVDAVDGPMPQTRFVTQKAFRHNLKPILVINKVDRDGARPDWVLDQTFDLFDRLGATEEQLDFPVIYTSAINGYASLDADVRSGDMRPLFEAIVDKVPPPDVNPDGPFQMQISTLDYSSFVGAIAVGRITRGMVKSNSQVTVLSDGGSRRNARILQILQPSGLGREEVPLARAGDIVAVTGIERPLISDTLCDPDHLEILPPLTVDEPTVSMMFQVNSSPFAGKEGKYLTSRQILDRLERELISNVALRVEPTEEAERFKVSGRGELHLSVLLETMRREGYEIAVSRPSVIRKIVDGVEQEPYEELSIDVELMHQGVVMETLGTRGANLLDMQTDGQGRVRLSFRCPSRGLIGLRNKFLTMTSGTGLMHHVFDSYDDVSPATIEQRQNGVLIANGTGKALGFSIANLQERGRMMISPSDEVYEGQVVGIHSRENDLVVNPLKGKQLTNVRASGKDTALALTPPVRFTLEQALEFITDDELLEITPLHLRIRKRFLKEHERKRSARSIEKGLS